MVLIDSYDDESPNSILAIWAVHPSSSYAISGAGQTFTPTSPYKITSIKFRLQKTGDITGDLVAELYAHTGTFGTGGLPTGSVLATSDKVDVSILSSSHALVEFTFSGGEQYLMSANTAYCIMLHTQYAIVDGNNYVQIGTVIGGSHEGNALFYYISVWNSSVRDTCFYVYGDLVSYSQRVVKFMPIHGWESGEEEYLKAEISSAGVLDTV